MLAYLLAPRFVAAYVFALAALYVHRRGRVRHTITRQLTDHSTLLAPLNCLLYAASAVPRTPLLDPRSFPELDRLRDAWQTIRDEAVRLQQAGRVATSDDYQDVAFNTFFDRGWRRFHLKWYDDFLPSAEAACPRTVALLREMPSVRAALFAMLPAGGKLTEHRDPYAGSLRYHLGLVTPADPRCHIQVDGERYVWRDGEDVVFDETYVHRAENKTDQDRLILFCDIARPLHTAPMRWIDRMASRHFLPIIASHNDAGERVGMLNRIAGPVHRVRHVLGRLKRRNRTWYYRVKWTLWAIIAAAVVLGPLLS